ncbi:serine/threonine-protein kinase ATM [Trifolium repens]|nr:serine/threonine-protein kinase ATM [Trifolium repens]
MDVQITPDNLPPQIRSLISEDVGNIAKLAIVLLIHKNLGQETIYQKSQIDKDYLAIRPIEEAKLFRAQGQNEMAVNLGIYISENYQTEASDVYRLIGKWLAETRSSKLMNKLILFNF